jgi:DNA primase
MMDLSDDTCPAGISLLDYLGQHGWRPVRDNGRDEVAGLCPFHQDSRPSFYVNRRKQVFYCHGCGRGGGLARLVRWLGGSTQPVAELSPEQLMDDTYGFYQRQLVHCDNALAYLAKRGIHDRAIRERMRIGYAPGACLRGYLTRLGYTRGTLRACGLVDERERDSFFRCLTFPLPETGNLYGRSITSCLCRHRFLPGSKGGLYGWAQSAAFSRVIVVEGLFDVAALWQAGFPNAVAALGSHLNQFQLMQLCRSNERVPYICFDADRNGCGQRAARSLCIQLRHAGVGALRVELPRGHDPASLFASGAGACDFRRLLECARP